MDRIILAATAAIVSSTTVGHAQERLALVIGNADYQTVRPVTTATADARLVADRLERLGFDVTVAINMDLAGMKNTIAEFGRNLRDAEPGSTSLFYYAGHGIHTLDVNYLLPVDAEIAYPADLDFVAIDARSVLNQFNSGSGNASILIFDCCGFNPYPDITSLQTNGFVEMSPPSGTAIAFSTQPGSVMEDPDGMYGVYANALNETLQGDDLNFDHVFSQTARYVTVRTEGAQSPWFSAAEGLEFDFAPKPELSPEEVAEKGAWEALDTSSDPLAVMTFIQTYPEGSYAEDAKRLLTSILSAELDAESQPEEPVTVAEVDPVETAEAPATRGVAPITASDTPMSEQEMIERAQISGEAEDYQAYLDTYPDGVFAELASSELAVALAKKDAPPAPQTPELETTVLAAAEPATETEPSVSDAPLPDPESVAFEAPLEIGADQITGKTIAQLIKGSPLFPPVEGLPDSYWKTETCSNCHQWTREDLCTQANFYTTAAGEKNMAKQHPLGGSFKRNLRAWAEGGCK